MGKGRASTFDGRVSGGGASVTGQVGPAAHPPRAPDRLEILGNKASVLFENDELKLLGPSPRSRCYDREAGYQASFDGVIRHFVECLETGAGFETDPADNLQTLRLVDHA